MDISSPLLDPKQELSEFKLNKYFDIHDIPTKTSVNDIIHSDFVLFKNPVRVYLGNINNSNRRDYLVQRAERLCARV